MSIEELVEKATIHLPRAISLDEAETLLKYLAEKLPANINYRPSYFRSLIHEQGKVTIDNGTVELTANVVSRKIPMSFDSLTFKPSDRDTSKLSEIQFQLVPGWGFSDYRPEVVKLWGDVRKIVSEYFSNERKK